jgi:hypothetical protein
MAIAVNGSVLHFCHQKTKVHLVRIQLFEKGEKMKKQTILLVIGLVLTSLILAACGSPSTKDSNFPTGRFVLPGSPSEGVYFNKDGTWSGFFGQQTVAEGTYHVEGDLYTEEAGPKACDTSATYRYSFDGTNLKFELVGEDGCQNRRESLDDITYVLTK